MNKDIEDHLLKIEVDPTKVLWGTLVEQSPTDGCSRLRGRFVSSDETVTVELPDGKTYCLPGPCHAVISGDHIAIVGWLVPGLRFALPRV